MRMEQLILVRVDVIEGNDNRNETMLAVFPSDLFTVLLGGEKGSRLVCHDKALIIFCYGYQYIGS